jgi:hypothetical protein
LHLIYKRSDLEFWIIPSGHILAAIAVDEHKVWLAPPDYSVVDITTGATLPTPKSEKSDGYGLNG